MLNEEKDLLPISQVKWVFVPRYDELSVRALWPHVKEQKDVMKYIPDRFRKGQFCQRSYFFNILNTVMPEYVKKLLEHANNLRMNIRIAEGRKECLIISERWYQKLMEFPFISSKYNIG